MTDTELGPDPNDVRRHAKKMLTEADYRRKYCRLDFYRPNRKQLEFHNMIARERMLRAGNQEGKCISFNTLIDHPDGTSTAAGALFNRGAVFEVLSYDGCGLVPALATCAIRKPSEIVVRVWMEHGGWFECALNHRVLTRAGWRYVGRLLQSVPCLESSNSECGRSTRLSSDRRWIEKALNWINRCFHGSHRHDGQPREIEAVSPAYRPSIFDARLHSPCGLRLDDLASTNASIVQSIRDHLSSPGVLGLALARSWLFLARNACSSFPHRKQKLPSIQRLSIAASFALQLGRAIFQGRSLLVSPVSNSGNKIIAYQPISIEPVYDFSVPFHHNYLAAGVIHHNTHAAGAQMAMDALGLYPDWYKGRKFLKPPAIERPYAFMGWAGCTTSVTTRDGIQTKLLGDIRQTGELGTGLIPLDNIVGRPTMARGIADFVDSITLRREVGGTAMIRQKTFEMGRKAWQGEAVDAIWVDEDPGGPPNDAIYGEALARLTTTRGQVICSMTPMMGLSPLRRRFKHRVEGTAEVLMTIDDARVSNGGHIPDEDIPIILAGYKDSERQTRAYGSDMQGEGAVFETPVDQIKHKLDPADVPPYWRWLWAVDFRHSGSQSTGHPFAAVLGCRDMDSDIIYVIHAVRLMGLAPAHVAAMIGQVQPLTASGAQQYQRPNYVARHPMYDAPVAWPHDGGRGASLIDGETIAMTYRRLGLPMLPSHATFENGGFSFEDGLTEMDNRFASGRLKIAAHLAEVFDEYQGYHRVNGLVHKIDDDLLSACRVLVMDIRRAKSPAEFSRFTSRRNDPAGQFAVGSVNHPQGEYDIFAGR